MGLNPETLTATKWSVLTSSLVT